MPATMTTAELTPVSVYV